MAARQPADTAVRLLVLLCITAASSAGEKPPVDPTYLRTAEITAVSDEPVYRDCSDLPPDSPSGVYELHPAIDPPAVTAYCDMDNDGGNWTVIIRRDDITPRTDFFQDWDTYKYVLGDLSGEFYWGNENIWMMTSHLDRVYQAHFYLEDWDGNHRYALYQDFSIKSEADNYRLLVGEYSGDAGDSFAYHNDHPFSTTDRDHDVEFRASCANQTEGAWWFGDCANCHLNGKYYPGGETGGKKLGIYWYFWTGAEYSLKTAVMKIKPVDNL